MRTNFTRKHARIGWLLALVIVSAMMVTPALAQRTYFIEESTDFTGNGCENTDLNNVTSYLRSVLKAARWTGVRYTNSSAWPQDFYEASFGIGGFDNLYSDTKTLSVYAGHGNINLLQFGFPRNGQCIVNINNQMRLGTLSGDQAAYMMYLTSCTMNVGGLANLYGNEVHQQFGYHNSPSIHDGQPGQFFDATAGVSNKNAWLAVMEDKPGWFTGDNSPIVLTFGTDASDSQNKHNNAKLKAGSWLGPASEPWGHWRYTLRDHGGC